MNFTTISILAGTTVRCYKNLHKNCISVQAKVNGNWKVLYHAKSVDLANAKFKVSQAGRKRVIEQKRKNVHAFVYGELIALDKPSKIIGGKKVFYSPYKTEEFVEVDSWSPISHSPFARIDQSKGIEAFY